PEDEVDVDLVEGGVDVPGLVADDVDFHVGGKGRRQPGQVLLDGLDHRHGVRARLTPHLEDHRGDAVHADGRALLLRAVLRPADVTQAHRGAIDRGDHEVVERPRIDHAAHGADRLLLPPGGDVAPGKVRVLPDDGVADGGDRNLVGGEAIGLDPDVD